MRLALGVAAMSSSVGGTTAPTFGVMVEASSAKDRVRGSHPDCRTCFQGRRPQLPSPPPTPWLLL